MLVREVDQILDDKDEMDLAVSLQPDVNLVYLKLPGANCLAALREILNTSPHIHILVLSMLEDDDSIFSAIPAVANGE